MVYRSVHPAHAVDDLREEFHLSLRETEHVHWLLHGGLLNPLDSRTMLARRGVATLSEKHGHDTNEWPSLATVLPPPRAQKTAPSQRGWGANAAPVEATGKDDRSPSVIVLDWALGRKSSPAPKPPQRPATTSPSGRAKFVDLRDFFVKKEKQNKNRHAQKHDVCCNPS